MRLIRILPLVKTILAKLDIEFNSKGLFFKKLNLKVNDMGCKILIGFAAVATTLITIQGSLTIANPVIGASFLPVTAIIASLATVIFTIGFSGHVYFVKPKLKNLN